MFKRKHRKLIESVDIVESIDDVKSKPVDITITKVDNTKQIRILIGVVRRLGKEKVHYLKEMDSNTAEVEKLRKAGKDEYDMKQAIAVLDETKMVIPVTERKFIEAYQKLDQLVKAGLTYTTEYKDAVEVLEYNRELLPVQ